MLRRSFYAFALVFSASLWIFLELRGAAPLITLLTPTNAMLERTSIGLILVFSGTGLGFLVPSSRLPQRFRAAPRLIGIVTPAFTAASMLIATPDASPPEILQRVATGTAFGLVTALLFASIAEGANGEPKEEGDNFENGVHTFLIIAIIVATLTATALILMKS